ncbi:tetratricopeptide repeat protein [Alienimonas sp. DA493]|uniref:tetratricopeptide repeat protein n=1 Tax=Alienimonas sp. DA493 TaxID=3373605 RepID=UPI0037543EC2
MSAPEPPPAAPTRREKLERLLADDPGDAFLRYSLALELAKTDEDAALREFDRVIEEHPDYVPAYFMKGQTLARGDRDEEARETLTAGIEVATRTGDDHAAGEMSGFLETLG